ncbi:ATP-binding cassette domain-containing protein [Actinomyces sp. W5033]|uniref:ATP-binding cassette domain-containing protein n=1 Tax=Actinomyces sp. W5033 TaxID=3446479 RepID=UPI003EDEE0BA
MTIVIRNLAVEIAGRRLVNGVCLDLAPGSSSALVGASGAGKSLTCAALAGTLPPGARAEGLLMRRGKEEPDGRPGNAVLPLPAQQRPEDLRVALVQQDPATALHPLLPVIEQVARAARTTRRGAGRRRGVARALELLTAVGLGAELAERVPGRLSGGQRQRAALALALACDPALLIADEPTTALDVIARAEVLNVLTAVLARLGDQAPALLLVTHDLPAAALCQHVVVMHDGRVIESGEALSVLTRPQHPLTRAMCAAAREETRAGALAATWARTVFGRRPDGAAHALGLSTLPATEAAR